MTTPKNLQPVNPPGPCFRFLCVKCGRREQSITTDGRENAYADLNGKPFVDYYCLKCAEEEGQQ